MTSIDVFVVINILSNRSKWTFYFLSSVQFNFTIGDYFLKFKFHKLGIKLGFELPLNHHIGSGIRIDHWGFLAINYGAKIGKNCHIYGDVTIGVKDENGSGAPILGDNVTIGAGARILGPVTIASNCVIGANAVVTHSVLEEGKIIAGIPAKVIGTVKK